jgi:dihydroorotate dehydrogenase electron transfer subunit
MLKPVKIRKIIKENYRIKTFVLDEEINSVPGQFVMLWLPRLGEKPMCVVDFSPLTFTIAKVGPFTKAIHSLKRGDTIWYRGPYGKGFKLKSKDVLLVGGGYGVAALYGLARQAKKKGLKATFIIGGKGKKDIIYENKLKKLGIKTIVSTEDGSSGCKGLVTEVVGEILKSGSKQTVYSAGPEKMMVALGKITDQFKVPCQLSIERFMKCGGLYLCGHCELSGLLVCVDGPVFDWKLIKKLPDFGVFHRNQAAQKVPL